MKTRTGWGQHSKPNIKRWEDGWAELILTLIKSPTLTVADNGTGDLWWARHYTVIDCYTAGLGWCLSSNYDLTILLSNVIIGGLQSDLVHSAPPRFIFQKDSKEISNLVLSALHCSHLFSEGFSWKFDGELLNVYQGSWAERGEGRGRRAGIKENSNWQ